MREYRVREAARILGISVQEVRSYALAVRRPGADDDTLSFQELSLVKAARSLVSTRVPPRRVKRALMRLREQLPGDRSIAEVQIVARGAQIVAQDGAAVWQPESGQSLFEFEGEAPAPTNVTPLNVTPLSAARAKSLDLARDEREASAEEWYALGCRLEDAEPERAKAAYFKAVSLDPKHADAHLNLGRLLHEARDANGAETHYRAALEARPDDATAAFNLGVALQDLGRAADALAAYARALVLDPRCADAHYNAARIEAARGHERAALQHLSAYRRLTRGSPKG